MSEQSEKKQKKEPTPLEKNYEKAKKEIYRLMYDELDPMPPELINIILEYDVPCLPQDGHSVYTEDNKTEVLSDSGNSRYVGDSEIDEMKGTIRLRHAHGTRDEKDPSPWMSFNEPNYGEQSYGEQFDVPASGSFQFDHTKANYCIKCLPGQDFSNPLAATYQAAASDWTPEDCMLRRFRSSGIYRNPDNKHLSGVWSWQRRSYPTDGYPVDSWYLRERRTLAPESKFDENEEDAGDHLISGLGMTIDIKMVSDNPPPYSPFCHARGMVVSTESSVNLQIGAMVRNVCVAGITDYSSPRMSSPTWLRVITSFIPGEHFEMSCSTRCLNQVPKNVRQIYRAEIGGKLVSGEVGLAFFRKFSRVEYDTDQEMLLLSDYAKSLLFQMFDARADMAKTHLQDHPYD